MAKKVEGFIRGNHMNNRKWHLVLTLFVKLIKF